MNHIHRCSPSKIIDIICLAVYNYSQINRISVLIGVSKMDYITIREASEKWGITPIRIPASKMENTPNPKKRNERK